MVPVLCARDVVSLSVSVLRPFIVCRHLLKKMGTLYYVRRFYIFHDMEYRLVCFVECVRLDKADRSTLFAFSDFSFLQL